MFMQNEEAKLDAMQRHWQHGRGGTSSTSLFEEINETEDILTLPVRQASRTNITRAVVPPTPPACICGTTSDADSDNETWDVQDFFPTPALAEKSATTLDASSLNDFPARYSICSLQPHQFPVVGVYIDKRIVPGFKYRVRPLPPIGGDSTVNKCLFNGRALTLQSIGRGYARRFTFEADLNQLNENDNYFWSDNRPEGYAFELEVLSEGDKFTIFDINMVPQGTLEVLQIEGPQIEIASSVAKSRIEKRANVTFTGKVEFFETGVAKPMLLTGTVASVKGRGQNNAEILKIANVTIKKQRYYLVPGIQKIHRRVTVRGEDINDVPTKYTMTGLEPYEIPVVGTYVDPRIIPGFHYRVRPNDRKEHLFGGRSLKLLSIGMGYAKRLTFEPDSLIEADNYLWSDNHPDGIGLEPRAIHKNMKFSIQAGDEIVGSATVFRVDKPQIEEKMEKIKTASGQFAIEKYIHIDVVCHVKLNRLFGNTNENEENIMRVYGLAVVRKEPKSLDSHVLRVENIAFDSSVNLLFIHSDTKLVFVPEK